MSRALAKGLVNSLALLVVSTFLCYWISSVALDPRAYYEDRTPRPSAAVVNAQLTALGLDPGMPVTDRFAHWARRALHGDLGRTLDGTSVNAEFGRRVGVTARLLVAGTVVGTVLGVLAGVWAATRRGRLPDRALTLFSFAVLSVPPFVLGLLLQTGALSVNDAAGRTVIRYTGESTPGLKGGPLTQVGDSAVHLVLPTLSVALGAIAMYSRYQRGSTLDVLGSDHLRTAHAKGLTPGRALLRHGLRTSLIPLTAFFSFGFLTLFTGAVFTEKIYGWHGMGSWFVESVQKGDVNAAVAVEVFSAALVLLAGLVAELLHRALDPRVRRA
ncbi:ABC transporter permease [Streptomyces cylindrosporus]|uniref:ABC transporter permease n=1 Tax=Streptomyces cylindrosporus TaxID=2927583 RepID=A0ABS9YEP5_9ACTN|nr:ABC transporter permease [Streptomyces cylindrosporus]MCI3275703.1 ABC transporter permease [Streptomyces cylindrosporus]